MWKTKQIFYYADEFSFYTHRRIFFPQVLRLNFNFILVYFALKLEEHYDYVDLMHLLLVFKHFSIISSNTTIVMQVFLHDGIDHFL